MRHPGDTAVIEALFEARTLVNDFTGPMQQAPDGGRPVAAVARRG